MATGTADVAMIIAGELAKLEGLGTAEGTVYPEVVGIDPSARMLEVRPLQSCVYPARGLADQPPGNGSVFDGDVVALYPP